MTKFVVNVQEPTPIEQQREKEREKYEWLARNRESYGASFHGRAAIDLVLAFKPQLVIDLGCGRNQFVDELRRRRVDALGVDFVYPEAQIQAPMHKTGLIGGTADVVTAFDALEHVLPEDVPRVLREAKRLARPGGWFVFSIATRPSKITVKGENLHPTVRDLGWWVREISKVGVVEQRRAAGRYIQGRFTRS